MRVKLGSSSISWLFVGAMFVLCGILGVLQYRWIGNVSVAERDRLQGRLQADLSRLSRDFNAELTAACRALTPQVSASTETVSPSDLMTRYQQWKKSTRHAQLFRNIALAVPRGEQLTLYSLDLESGATRETSWPKDWKSLEDRMHARLSPDGWRGRGGPGQRPAAEAHVFELPIFGQRSEGGPHGPFGHAEAGWLILDLNTSYVGDVLLPELVQRHIGNEGGGLDYQVDVLSRSTPPVVIYQTSTTAVKDIGNNADASMGLFDIQMDHSGRVPTAPAMVRRRKTFVPAPIWDAGK